MQTPPSPGRPLVAVILDAASPYDRLIIGGVAQYAREHGPWSLYVEEDPLQKLPDLRRWHGHGIIANFDDRAVARAIEGLLIPMVGVGGGFGWHAPGSGIPYIYTDNERIARLGAEHLLGCGFDQLAFCGFRRTRVNGWVAERAAAFDAACREAGRGCSIFTGRQATARRWQELQRELCDWLVGLPKPVGIMACNDVRARHLLEACRTLGLVVPRDVAVLGVDNDEVMCELTEPPLSSIDQAARRIGYEAAAVLHSLMRERASTDRQPVGRPRRSCVIAPIGVVARASTDTMATEDETVRLVLDRLRADPWARPDLAALAATACVSRSTLEHRFQAVVGRSIHEAFVRQRVAGVRRLVAETNLPLKAIASRTGFKSVQYMTTFLHRHAGLTPARLRSLERAASRLTGSLEDRSSKAPDDLAAKADAPAALPEKT
jgi:LacI family transcriptional regulator